MGRNKKILLFLLLALLHVCAFADKKENCSVLPDNLSCYNDFSRNITCVWNSTYDRADTVCTIHARRDTGYTFSSSCNLEPVDVSRPALKKCSLIFKREWTFLSSYNLTLNLRCNLMKQSLTSFYKPACHIKLDPPQKPDINFTTVSWFPQVIKHERVSLYRSQLQWKREDQSWNDPSVLKEERQHKWNCSVELELGQLIRGQRYEARIRVQAVEYPKPIWSEWGPTASWVSLVGTTPASDFAGGVWGITAGVAAFAMFLVIMRFRTDKITWVYMIKIIRGPPLPNPANSFMQNVNFQSWLSPHYTSESFHSFWKPEEIVSVEATSAVDAVAPYGPEAALLEKMRSESSYESTSSNFSNPSYSQVSPPPPPPPPPPVSSLTAGNLEQCGANAPYGPVGGQGEGENAKQAGGEARGKEVEILQLLCKGGDGSEPMPVISDYEKVERPQVERSRLQSLDSGMCSCEEVSQESLEADSIIVVDEGPEGREERERGDGKEVDFQKLFGGSGGVLGKGSIQVCSDYERVQKLQADSPELHSLDSGISSGGEEQASQEESLEDVDKSTESTTLLFPPASPPSSDSLPSSAPLPLSFSGPGLSLERTLISMNRSVEPSGDGYLPVRQEQS